MPNQTFSELRLEKHPDKTFIGRIEKGFDFLGYHFSPECLSVAEKTIEKFLSRAVRRYEQEPGGAFSSSRLGLYVERWVRWSYGGAARRGFRKGRPFGLFPCLPVIVIVGASPPPQELGTCVVAAFLLLVVSLGRRLGPLIARVHR